MVEVVPSKRVARAARWVLSPSHQKPLSEDRAEDVLRWLATADALQQPSLPPKELGGIVEVERRDVGDLAVLRARDANGCGVCLVIRPRRRTVTCVGVAAVAPAPSEGIADRLDPSLWSYDLAHNHEYWRWLCWRMGVLYECSVGRRVRTRGWVLRITEPRVDRDPIDECLLRAVNATRERVADGAGPDLLEPGGSPDYLRGKPIHVASPREGFQCAVALMPVSDLFKPLGRDPDSRLRASRLGVSHYQ